MVFEHARISFDERGIINLKGYNSSGKTTVERALAVCFLDAFKRNQQKFIRHGEDYFRVIVDFDDGVKIIRDKYLNGQSLYEMYKDDECIYSTMEGNRLSRISDVPEPIQDYLGLIVLGNGCLNYQSRRDPLWLIETPGSENYYALNEALKTESIARANAMINSDRNDLGSKIAELEYSLHSIELSLEDCSPVTEELISSLSEREVYALGKSNQSMVACKLVDTVERVAELKEIPKVEGISYERLSAVLEIERVLLEIEKLSEIPEVKSLETGKLSLLEKIVKNSNELASLESSVLGVNVDKVDYKRVHPVSKILEGIEKFLLSYEELKGTVKQEKEVKSKLDTVVKEAKGRGIKFVKCDNCGSYMEVGDKS